MDVGSDSSALWKNIHGIQGPPLTLIPTVAEQIPSLLSRAKDNMICLSIFVQTRLIEVLHSELDPILAYDSSSQERIGLKAPITSVKPATDLSANISYLNAD